MWGGRMAFQALSMTTPNDALNDITVCHLIILMASQPSDFEIDCKQQLNPYSSTNS